MARPFQSELVLEERISEASLRAYHVGFDQNRFRLQPLVDIIRRAIPEFALGYHAGDSIPITFVTDKLKEAALTVFDTDNYMRRGEFGELILHLLLRDFCYTVPLISKIYFKDSNNITVHGFDGVHVTEGSESKLWLGESKLYQIGVMGVRDLASDLRKHIEADYLRKEFNLVSRKIPSEIPNRSFWIKLMDKHNTLDKVYSSIVIPMVCTYTSKLFIDHTSETTEYISAFESECRFLKNEFDQKCIQTNVEVILMLLPVENKDELNMELFKRLKSLQEI